MSSIVLHRKFVDDLLTSEDSALVARVLKHVFNEADGEANKKNDHRYDGVEDAWIRYVSRGKTAYRIIYLRRNGRNVFWRCGVHSIEDRLTTPSTTTEDLCDVEISGGDVIEMTKPLSILATHRPPHIYTALLGRRLIPNKAAYLVSPFIESSLLARGTMMGQFLDSIVRDGTEVVVICAAERVRDHDKLHRDLAARGIEMVFTPRLHSKVYLFITDETRNHVTARTPSLGIIGSSNLTQAGIPSTVGYGNLEVNYTVDPSSIELLESIVTEYYVNAKDYLGAMRMNPNMTTRELK